MKRMRSKGGEERKREKGGQKKGSPGNRITLTFRPSSTNLCSRSLTCVVLPLRSSPSKTIRAPRATAPAWACWGSAAVGGRDDGADIVAAAVSREAGLTITEVLQSMGLYPTVGSGREGEGELKKGTVSKVRSRAEAAEVAVVKMACLVVFVPVIST